MIVNKTEGRKGEAIVLGMRLAEPDNEIGKSLKNGHKKESGNGTIR